MKQTATSVLIDFFNGHLTKEEQSITYLHLTGQMEMDRTGADNVMQFLSLLSGADEQTTKNIMNALEIWRATGQIELIDFSNPENVTEALARQAKSLFENSIAYMSYIAGTDTNKEKTWPILHKELLTLCNKLSKLEPAMKEVLTKVETTLNNKE